MLKPLSRKTINKVCDAVLPLAAMNKASSVMATNVCRERLRKQLIGKSMKDDDESIQLLITYVNKREALAQIKDYTFIGLQSSEAISKEIAQASQSAFKASTKNVVLSDIVSSLKSITGTVKNRKDQKITVHFDQDYSRFGNFSTEEVVAMRSVFVSTTMEQLLVKEPVIGILGAFNNDKVSESTRKLRNEALQRYNTPVITPGIWNKMVTGLKEGKTFAQSILIMRFNFDQTSMYARNVSMLDILGKFQITVVSDIGKNHNMAVTGSSLKDGIIDVCVEVSHDPLMSRFQSELLILDSVIKDTIKEFHVGGIDKVNDMNIENVNMNDNKLLMTSKPPLYTIAELGKKRWIDANDLDFEDIEDYMSIVPEDHLNEHGYVTLGPVRDDKFIVFLSEGKSDDDMHYDDPTDDEVTNAFASYYIKTLSATRGKQIWMNEHNIDDPDIDADIRIVPGNKIKTLGDNYYVIDDIQLGSNDFCVLLFGDALRTTKYSAPTHQELLDSYANYYISANEITASYENLWVIELNIVAFKLACINYEQQLVRMFEYCGINPSDVVNHELVELPYYVYVLAEDDPKLTMLKYFGAKQEIKYDQMTAQAKAIVNDYAFSINGNDELEADDELFYTTHRDIINQRISKYVYAVLDVAPKKGPTGEKFFKYYDTMPYDQHVVHHAYTSVIKIPFVDRYKTMSNDWYTNTYTLGADCARNIYADGFFQIASASSDTDPRHVELFCDVVFEKGFPAGAGQHSSEAHGMGTTTQMSAAKQKLQLATNWNKGAESVGRVDVATFFGTTCITLGSKTLQIRANERKARQDRELAGIRMTRKYDISVTGQAIKTVTYAESESALELYVRAIHIGVDPFNIAIDIPDPRVFDNKPPTPDVPLSTYYMSRTDSIILRVRRGADTWIEALGRYKSYKETTARDIVMTKTSGIVNIAPLYIFLLANKVGEFFLP